MIKKMKKWIGNNGM